MKRNESKEGLHSSRYMTMTEIRRFENVYDVEIQHLNTSHAVYFLVYFLVKYYYTLI